MLSCAIDSNTVVTNEDFPKNSTVKNSQCLKIWYRCHFDKYQLVTDKWLMTGGVSTQLTD